VFEWLICAAGVVTQAATGPGAAALDEAPTDFLEFLADWDESESTALDLDEPLPGDEASRAQIEDRSSGLPGVENRMEARP